MAGIKKIITSATMTSVGEDVEKLEPSYIAGEDVKWRSHFGKQFGGSSKS